MNARLQDTIRDSGYDTFVIKQVTILGVPVASVTMQGAVKILIDMLHTSQQHHVATPNNEMLVEAQKNAAFKKVLQGTQLNIPDSTGLLWAAKNTGQHLPERVTGVDTVTALCSLLPADQPVFLLGAKEGVAHRAAEALKEQNPNLSIAGTYAGSPSSKDAESIVQMISHAKPAILLVAFGAPAQEMWIAENLGKLSSVRIAMGVGGTFDFLSGARKRAPKWMQRSGLEWLWRLLQQPSRIGRIWKAVVVFPYLVFRHGR